MPIKLLDVFTISLQQRPVDLAGGEYQPMAVESGPGHDAKPGQRTRLEQLLIRGQLRREAERGKRYVGPVIQ